MPPSPSAGLLAFLLALPSLAVGLPPASDAAATAAPAETSPPGAAAAEAMGADGPPARDEPMEARLRRLSEAIRARAGQLEDQGRGPAGGEPWLAGGAWGNGRGRGWLNRGWSNGSFGNNDYRRPSVWANFRPGWGNFRNAPRFINW